MNEQQKADYRERLSAPFPYEDLEWKPAQFPKDKRRVNLPALTYVTNRAVMDRLDDVFGIDGWETVFVPGPSGGIACRLTCWFRSDGVIKASETGITVPSTPTRFSITRENGAENTKIEAIKGGFSGSMKRAAVQFGIGRYLYRMPLIIAPFENGRFDKIYVPDPFLPEHQRGDKNPSRGGYGDPARTNQRNTGTRQRQPQRPQQQQRPQQPQPAQQRATSSDYLNDQQVQTLQRLLQEHGWDRDTTLDLIGQYGATQLGELTRRDYTPIVKAIKQGHINMVMQ